MSARRNHNISATPSPKVADNKHGGRDSRAHSNAELGDKTVQLYNRPNDRPISDSASPSGRLGDRIERLRKRCIEALGREAFNDAYTFLKQHEEVRN